MSTLIYFIIAKTAEYWFQDRTCPVENYVFGNISEQLLAVICKSIKAGQFRTACEESLAMEHQGTHRLPAPCRRCYNQM